MERRTRRSYQLALMLQREQQPAWPTDTQQALIAALADLLLEALGSEEAPQPAGGDPDEPEDHR